MKSCSDFALTPRQVLTMPGQVTSCLFAHVSIFIPVSQIVKQQNFLHLSNAHISTASWLPFSTAHSITHKIKTSLIFFKFLPFVLKSPVIFSNRNKKKIFFLLCFGMLAAFFAFSPLIWTKQNRSKHMDGKVGEEVTYVRGKISRYWTKLKNSNK